MKEERIVIADGKEYIVVISDETEALLAAKAARRAIVGLWDRNAANDLSAAGYLVESLEDVDEVFLEKVVRRNFGLPWIIGETKRLIIREFQLEDARKIPGEESDTEADQVFSTPGKLAEYIRCQYGFYEYGIWALVDKASGQIIGKAGVTNWEEDVQNEDGGLSADQWPSLELGYHIFCPYRGQGYATEACREILKIVKAQWENCRIYAKIDASNEASIGVINSCGFKPEGRTYSGALRYSYPCAGN